jgi:hypothetical protein
VNLICETLFRHPRISKEDVEGRGEGERKHRQMLTLSFEFNQLCPVDTPQLNQDNRPLLAAAARGVSLEEARHGELGHGLPQTIATWRGNGT